MRSALAVAAVFVAALPAVAWAFAPETSLRPQLRVSAKDPVTPQLASANLSFNRWISEFRRRAVAKGIQPQVFETAFQGVRYDADVILSLIHISEPTRPY